LCAIYLVLCSHTSLTKLAGLKLMALLQSDLSFGLTLHGTFPDSFSSGEHQLIPSKHQDRLTFHAATSNRIRVTVINF
jgi:hypothetical protein